MGDRVLLPWTRSGDVVKTGNALAAWLGRTERSNCSVPVGEYAPRLPVDRQSRRTRRDHVGIAQRRGGGTSWSGASAPPCNGLSTLRKGEPCDNVTRLESRRRSRPSRIGLGWRAARASRPAAASDESRRSARDLPCPLPSILRKEARGTVEAWRKGLPPDRHGPAPRSGQSADSPHFSGILSSNYPLPRRAASLCFALHFRRCDYGKTDG
jgi:hypothetical protein